MYKEPDPEVDEIARRVIGCAIEVHRNLGPGYLETLYENALCREFDLNTISYVNQHPINVAYKDALIGEGRLDFIIEGMLIVEIKAVSQLLPIHFTQVKSYLKSTGLQLGLLINFNERRLGDGIKRVVQIE